MNPKIERLEQDMPRASTLRTKLDEIEDTVRDKRQTISTNSDMSAMWKIKQLAALEDEQDSMRADARSAWLRAYDLWVGRTAAVSSDPPSWDAYRDEQGAIGAMLANGNPGGLGDGNRYFERANNWWMAKDVSRLMAWANAVQLRQIDDMQVDAVIAKAKTENMIVDAEGLEDLRNRGEQERLMAECFVSISPLEQLYKDTRKARLPDEIAKARKEDEARDRDKVKPNWGAGGTITYGGRPAPKRAW